MNIPGNPNETSRNRWRLVTVLALLLLGGTRSFAGALIVTNAADSGAGSLRAAISDSLSGSLIVFANTMAGQAIHLTSGELLITNDLTIDASALTGGVLIDAGKNSRVMEITNANVTLNSLTVTNGRTVSYNPSDNYGSGGGILVDNNAVLAATNCVISGNTTSIGNGGGIYNEGSLALNHCLLSGNSATDEHGGGIYNVGLLTLNYCTLSGNSAQIYGGGIYGNGTNSLNDCTLSGNSASNEGGGIFNNGVSTLGNCTLFGNSTGGGGGIYNNTPDLTAVTLTLNNCTVSGNTAISGGGIFNGAYVMVLTNTIVAGNVSQGGGDIAGYSFSGVNNLTSGNPQLAPLGNYGGPTQTMPPLVGSPAIDAGSDTVTNFLATDQRGFARLAGTHVDIGAVELQARLTVVTTNSDDINGFDVGGVSLRKAVAYATNGTPVTFAPDLSGATILLTNGELFISNNLTIDASALAGGVIIDAGKNSRVLEIAAGNVTLDSLVVTNGSVTNNGGGILVDGGASLTATECTVSGNFSASGGGIANGGTLTCTHCVVSNNSATNGNGGGILVDSGASLTATECTVSGNSSASGGGIANGGTLTCTHCMVSNNSATNGAGGGIFNYPGNITLNQVTLSGNHASSYGGAIENDGPLTLNNCTLAENTGNGGGAINDNAPLKAVQCTFAGNTTVGGGGSAIWAGPSNVIINCTFAGNIGDAAIRQYQDGLILLTNTIGDVGGSFSGANNFTNSDPGLASLGSYGGPTQTMPPLPGSPVIDAGDDAAASLLFTDQRGYPRKSGAHVDIGAVEMQYASGGIETVLKNPVWTSTGGGGGAFQFKFTSSAILDFTALTSTNLALPLTNWTVLGNVPQISPGQYQFTDPAATNAPQRFYRVVSP